MLQRIKKSIESGEIKEESGNVIWTNSSIGQIIRLDILLKTFLLSFVEKDSHSFKKSYGLKEFISHIETQSTELDVLLVQVKAIVSILTKYGSIKRMEESIDQILQCDNNLNNHIAEIIELFNQTSLTKTYSLSKINSAQMRAIEEAQRIICLWKQSPLSTLFNAVWDQLIQAWIYIDIFDTKYYYKLGCKHKGSTNQVFSRLFEVLTKSKFNIHQSECIEDWDSIQQDLVDNGEESEVIEEEEEEDSDDWYNEDIEESDEEGENEKEDCFDIDCK